MPKKKTSEKLKKAKRVKLEYANLVVRFGDGELLENYANRFAPSLNRVTTHSRGRTTSRSMRDLELMELGDEKIPCLVGRIAKDLVYKAEQVRDPNSEKLIPSDKQLPATHTSYFVLILASHKLAFVREQANSPTLKEFESFLKAVVSKQTQSDRKDLVDELIKTETLKNGKITSKKANEIKKQALKVLPSAEVRVTPIPSVVKIGERFEKYKIVKFLKIVAFKRNSEWYETLDEFIDEYRKMPETLNTPQVSFIARNPRDGISLERAKTLATMASDGNFDIEIRGEDIDGHKFKDEMDEISLVDEIEIPENVKTLRSKARLVLERCLSALRRNKVALPDSDSKTTQLAKNLIETPEQKKL